MIDCNGCFETPYSDNPIPILVFQSTVEQVWKPQAALYFPGLWTVWSRVLIDCNGCFKTPYSDNPVHILVFQSTVEQVSKPQAALYTPGLVYALYMHNHDNKNPARPGFEPGTSRLQTPVYTNEPSRPVLYDVPRTEDVGLPTQFRFNVGPTSQPIVGSMRVNRLRSWPNTNPTLGLLHTLRQLITFSDFAVSKKNYLITLFWWRSMIIFT